MKKILMAFCLFAFGIVSFAQNSFESKIKENTVKLNSATSVEQLDALFGEFSTLISSGDQNNKWKAFYYAGFAQYKKAELLLKSNETASAANANDLAYKYLLGGVSANKAEYKRLLKLLDEQKNKLSLAK